MIKKLVIFALFASFIVAQDSESGLIESSSNNIDAQDSESSAQESQIRVNDTQALPPEMMQNNPYLTQDSDNSQGTSLLDNLYGHVGFFGKTSLLGKQDDSYGVFSASLGFIYQLFDIELGLGIYGMTHMLEYPNNNVKNYITSKFVTNNAYVKYKMEDFFSVSAGRYRAHRDWLRNFTQGLGIDINYSWIKVWAEWSDEQAIAGREYLSDFDIFKRNYNKEFLISSGVELNLFGLELAPYYYFLNKYFWTAGGKIALDIDIGESWNTTTTAHYAFLSSKRNNDESKILWIEEALAYKNGEHEVDFGAGYIQVWDSNFELANLGSISRFQMDSFYGYNGIESGELISGSNASNMFNANTSTIYGFIGYKMNVFSLLFLGRYSRDKNNGAQDLYSLGAKWKILEGFYLGGVGAFMRENNRNVSYAKGYIEFAI